VFFLTCIHFGVNIITHFGFMFAAISAPPGLVKAHFKVMDLFGDRKLKIIVALSAFEYFVAHGYSSAV